MNNLSRRFFFILCTSALLISFQNFSYHQEPGEKWEVVDPALLNQPQQASDLAIPQSGHDLQSVASDWSNRQKDMILQGRDKVILDSWNEKLKNFFESNDPEEKPKIKDQAAQEPQPTGGSRQPASVRFTQVNRIEYQVDESSAATCSFDGQGADFVFSKSLGPSKLELRHQSAQGNTSLSFNLPF